MQLNTILTLTTSLLITTSAFAQTVDGLVADLGAARATDPTGGWVAPGDEGGAGNNPPMDLADLYVADNGTNVYLGLTVNSDIGVNNWGKYKVFIQTNNGGAGGTTDPWGRAINSGGTFSPQYVVSSWVDAGGGSEFHKWNGTSWILEDATWNAGDSNSHSVGISAAGNGGRGGVEWGILRSALGNAATVSVEGVSTANGGGDNGQDTVPTDVNATDWGTITVLDAPQAPITVPVAVSSFSID